MMESMSENEFPEQHEEVEAPQPKIVPEPEPEHVDVSPVQERADRHVAADA